MSLRTFELAIDKFIDEVVPEKHQLLLQAVAMQVLTGVVQMSPVDTGRFRGNWQVTIGSPSRQALLATDKSGAPTITNGVATIEGAPPFGVIYITNNLVYAAKLEEGHSRQAPAGMVAVTIANVESQFR